MAERIEEEDKSASEVLAVERTHLCSVDVW